MAVARTGSISVVADGSNTNSASITVPPGASLAVMFCAGYYDTGTSFLTPDAAPTLGGNTMSQAREQDGEELVKGGTWYLKNPPSGTQTLAWNHGGTSNASTGGVFFVVYYTGSDGTTPIGATGGDQDTGGSISAGSLANSSGDMVAGFGWAFRSGSSPTITWGGGLSEIQDDTQNGGAPSTYGSYAELAGSGSGITPSHTWTGDDGGVIGLVIKAAAAAGGDQLEPWQKHGGMGALLAA